MHANFRMSFVPVTSQCRSWPQGGLSRCQGLVRIGGARMSTSTGTCDILCLWYCGTRGYSDFVSVRLTCPLQGGNRSGRQSGSPGSRCQASRGPTVSPLPCREIRNLLQPVSLTRLSRSQGGGQQFADHSRCQSNTVAPGPSCTTGCSDGQKVDTWGKVSPPCQPILFEIRWTY